MTHEHFLRLFLVLLALSLVSVPVSVLGQISPQVTEAAKKEGEVMLYGAIPIQLSKPIGDLFEKTYGIKLKHWRGDATELINRSLAEARAGKNYFDVILGNEGVMMSVDEKGLLGAFAPPAARTFPKQFRQANQRMTPWRVLPYGINFNTQRLQAETAPKTWEQLLDPKWKKEFAMANPAIHITTLQFVLNLEKLLGDKSLTVVEGWAKQEPRLGRSLSQSVQALVSGEIPVAISYIKDKFQYAGPIDYVRMDRYLASVSFVGVNPQAPHPNAARLFTDFFLGPEVQKMFGDHGEYVINPAVDHRFKKDVKDEQIVVMDLPKKEDLDKWVKRFRELFG
jgi:iron(III) transport system substrate-binding protein